MATQNFKLSLIALTCLHQLQQYFLHSKMAIQIMEIGTNMENIVGQLPIQWLSMHHWPTLTFQKNCHPMIRMSLLMFCNSNRKKENMECVHLWRNGLLSSQNQCLSMPTMQMRKVKGTGLGYPIWDLNSSFQTLILQKMVGMYQKCHLLHLWIQMQTSSITCQKWVGAECQEIDNRPGNKSKQKDKWQQNNFEQRNGLYEKPIQCCIFFDSTCEHIWQKHRV